MYTRYCEGSTKLIKVTYLLQIYHILNRCGKTVLFRTTRWRKLLLNFLKINETFTVIICRALQKRCVFCYTIYIYIYVKTRMSLYNVHSTEWHLSWPRVLHAHYARVTWLARASRVQRAPLQHTSRTSACCILQFILSTGSRVWARGGA